jgi:hypothetical protein
MFKSKFLAAPSILVLAMSAPAFAQQAVQSQADNSGAAEQIVVTASRISIAGYEWLIPVTVGRAVGAGFWPLPRPGRDGASFRRTVA